MTSCIVKYHYVCFFSVGVVVSIMYGFDDVSDTGYYTKQAQYMLGMIEWQFCLQLISQI